MTTKLTTEERLALALDEAYSLIRLGRPEMVQVHDEIHPKNGRTDCCTICRIRAALDAAGMTDYDPNGRRMTLLKKEREEQEAMEVTA